MSETMTITLAGKAYEIQRLTLSQLRDLSIGVISEQPADPREFVRESFDRGVEAIAIALRVSAPELTKDALYELPITKEEFRAAHDQVLIFSGIVPPKRSAEELKAQIAVLQSELAEREAEGAQEGEAGAAVAAA